MLHAILFDLSFGALEFFLCASVVIISHFRNFFVYFELLCSIVWACSVGCEFSVLFIYLFALYL